MKLLYVDCTTGNPDVSRTSKLCEIFIRSYIALHRNVELKRVVLRDEDIRYYTADMVNKRSELISEEKFDDPIFRYAKDFAEADRILIGAPFWDMSFPALLKIYFENIFAQHVTFMITPEGYKSLCRATHILYITTAGGFIGEEQGLEQYMASICRTFGIQYFDLLSAEGLDIQNADVELIMKEAATRAKIQAIRW